MNKKAMDAMKQVKSAMAALEMCMNMPMEDGEEMEEDDSSSEMVSNETKGMEQMGDSGMDKKKLVMSMMKKKMGM